MYSLLFYLLITNIADLLNRQMISFYNNPNKLHSYSQWNLMNPCTLIRFIKRSKPLHKFPVELDPFGYMAGYNMVVSWTHTTSRCKRFVWQVTACFYTYNSTTRTQRQLQAQCCLDRVLQHIWRTRLRLRQLLVQGHYRRNFNRFIFLLHVNLWCDDVCLYT